jgi:hypothetical protein
MIRTVRLDAYVLDTLLRDLVGHDQQPSAFLTYLCLVRLAGGGRRPKVQVSLQQLAGESGLSKRAVQGAVSHLVRRHLVRAERAHATAVPIYEVLRPWRRPR